MELLFPFVRLWHNPAPQATRLPGRLTGVVRPFSSPDFSNKVGVGRRLRQPHVDVVAKTGRNRDESWRTEKRRCELGVVYSCFLVLLVSTPPRRSVVRGQ